MLLRWSVPAMERESDTLGERREVHFILAEKPRRTCENNITFPVNEMPCESVNWTNFRRIVSSVERRVTTEKSLLCPSHVQ